MNKTFILFGLLFITVPILADIGTCPTFTGINCDGTCRRIANCTNCGTAGIDGVEVCTACANGLYPNGLSTACVNCQQATGEKQCTACQYDTKLVRTKCIACNAGNGLNTLNQCVTCSIQNCGSCSVDDKGEQTCTTCNTGYFIKDSKTCAPCSTNCNKCSDATTCTTCAIKYYLDKAACSSCPSLPDCNECGGVDKCTICADKYVLGSDKKCYLIIPDCVEYNDVANSKITCKDCALNFAIQDSGASCKAVDVLNCVEYVDNTNDCTKCSLKHYLIPATPAPTAAAAKCGDCIANCIECSNADPTICGKCDDKYFFDSTATPKKCTQCTANCDKCSSSATCTTCTTGYYGNGQAACTICPTSLANCAACSDATTCTLCNKGFWSDGKTCQAITIPNCVDQKAAAQCGSCDTGFKKSLNNGDVCVSCGNVIPGCTDCDWKSIDLSINYNNNVLMCKTCMPGYYLVNQVCVPCPFGCSQCTITTVNTAGAVILADEGLVLATAVTNSYTSYTQKVSCDACLSGLSLQNSNSYCAKSSSSYLLFALVQLILVAFLLF